MVILYCNIHFLTFPTCGPRTVLQLVNFELLELVELEQSEYPVSPESPVDLSNHSQLAQRLLAVLMHSVNSEFSLNFEQHGLVNPEPPVYP